MKDITYRCDLCQASCKDEVIANYLVGLHWVDHPFHGWDERDPRTTEHHICKTCLKSLQTFGRKPAKDVQA